METDDSEVQKLSNEIQELIEAIAEESLVQIEADMDEILSGI